MNFLLQILIVLVVATAVGFLVLGLIPFWITMVLAIAAQFLIMHIIYEVKTYYNNKAELQAEAEAAAELAKQMAPVECPCGEYKTTEFVYINYDNIFHCPKCDRDFKVLVDLKSVLTTDVFDVNENMLQTFNKLNEKINENQEDLDLGHN